MIKRYNRYTHDLCPLQAGDTVIIQNPFYHQWNSTSRIIIVLPDCPHQIRVDGSGRIMLRNCHFLRKLDVKAMSTPIPSAIFEPTSPTSNVPLMHPDPPTSSSNDAHEAIRCPTGGTYISKYLGEYCITSTSSVG